MLNAYNDDASANIPLEFRASKFAFQSGNVGINTTTPVQPLQLGAVSVIAQDANSMYIGANFGSGTGGNYIKSQFANQIHFDSAVGSINFKVAASGTLGNAISYTTALTIASTGAATFSGNVNVASATVLAGAFKSATGSVSLASGATSTIFTMGLNGLYQVVIGVTAGGIIYSASSIFLAHVSNGEYVKCLDLYDGANVTLTNVGNAVQITNNGFVTLNWTWTYIYQPIV
jgi:hypothetical protein